MANVNLLVKALLAAQKKFDIEGKDSPAAYAKQLDAKNDAIPNPTQYELSLDPDRARNINTLIGQPQLKGSIPLNKQHFEQNPALRETATPENKPSVNQSLDESTRFDSGPRFDSGKDTIKGDPELFDYRSKSVLDDVEALMGVGPRENKLAVGKKYGLKKEEMQIPKSEEEAFDIINAGEPKPKSEPLTVQSRAKKQAGRKSAIMRGDQKYMPQGNKETGRKHDPDLVRHEMRNLEQEVMDEVDASVKQRQIRKNDRSKLPDGSIKRTDPDYEANQMDKEIDRIEEMMARDIVDDPLFPNPSHPSSPTSKRIKASGNQVEINEEIQDIVGLFEQRGIGAKQTGMFDVEKLRKATLNPSPALKAAAKGDPTKKATRAAIEKIAAIKINSRLWDAWDKLSGLAPLARKGDQKALAEIRAIGDWLIKAKRSPTALATDFPHNVKHAGASRIIKPRPAMSISNTASASPITRNAPPVLETLKRKQTGFDPRLIGAPYATGADAVPFPSQLRQQTQSTPFMEQIKKGMKPSETMEARGRRQIMEAAGKRK